MGNSNRGANLAKGKQREEQRQERSPQRDTDAPLPPLVVLKDAGAQTTVSHPVRSAKKRGPLVNRIATWVLIALIPYLGLCALIAHSDFMQSVLTYAHYPRNLKNPRELQDLVSYGLISARNIGVVRDEDGVLLRGWHVLPLAGSKKRMSELASLSLANSTDEINLFYDAELARGDKPIVILLHGNTHNRALWYRVGQAKHLSQVLDAHIVAFDYAGFGDSEGWPSEESTYRDAHAMYSWVLNAIERGRDALSDSAVCSAYPVKVCSSAPPRAKVILYGHSLGSAIALQLSKDLASSNDGSSPFSGVVLDAPFVTFSEAIMSHPRSAPLRLFPLVRDYLIRNLKNKYDSIDKIGLINAPLLILHGKLDDKIPISHSRRLLEATTQQGEEEAEAGEPRVGRKPPVTLVELEGGNHINNFQQPGWVVEMIKFYSSLS